MVKDRFWDRVEAQGIEPMAAFFGELSTGEAEKLGKAIVTIDYNADDLGGSAEPEPDVTSQDAQPTEP
ncbi:MAG: hypothetical protein GC137_02635 [Alphaproteobacteria bacterium]|nr:hypothetical protein [Alphaproteobacteria bacterium]